jgi:predicted transcriptional regulator
MASEVLALTAQIVMSHASMTQLTTKELVREIKVVYSVLSSLENTAVRPEATAACPTKIPPVKMVESPAAKAIENEAGPVIGDPDYMEFMESREG